jgi:Short C-terminal domain
MLNTLIRAAIIALVLTVTGCANPPIVPLGSDTYLLSKEDHAGIFGSMSKLKAEVISEANQFAESKGQVAIPISVREKPVGNSPGDWASFEYQFKLVDKGSTEAASTSFNTNRKEIQVRPNVSVQSSHSTSADINVNSASTESKDRYSELLKLDDLRKRGIITESEFEKQKERLLNGK